MEAFKAQRLKAALKQQLRLKKITYRDLARQLDCSEPTVKRILGHEEISLNRLLQILQIVDLGLSDLELLATQGEPQKDSFSPAQEAFLAKHPNHFAYLMQLYSGASPKQIAERHQLNLRSTDKYLMALEKAELIRVTGRQVVKPAYKVLPGLGKGVLAKAYFESFIRTAMHFFIRLVGDELYTQQREQTEVPKAFVVQTAKVSQETYSQWMHDQERALENFTKQAEYEEKTRVPATLKTVVLMSAGSIVPNDYKHLADLENAFGEIVILN